MGIGENSVFLVVRVCGNVARRENKALHVKSGPWSAKLTKRLIKQSSMSCTMQSLYHANIHYMLRYFKASGPVWVPNDFECSHLSALREQMWDPLGKCS